MHQTNQKKIDIMLNFTDLKEGNEVVTKYETFVIFGVLKNSFQIYNKRTFKKTGKKETSLLPKSMFKNSLFLNDLVSLK